MPQDQCLEDTPDIGESTGQFGSWEIDLRDLRELRNLHAMVLTLSDTACRIYGIEPTACALDDLLQRVHPDERRRVRDTLQAALRQPRITRRGLTSCGHTLAATLIWPATFYRQSNRSACPLA